MRVDSSSVTVPEEPVVRPMVEDVQHLHLKHHRRGHLPQETGDEGRELLHGKPGALSEVLDIHILHALALQLNQRLFDDSRGGVERDTKLPGRQHIGGPPVFCSHENGMRSRFHKVSPTDFGNPTASPRCSSPAGTAGGSPARLPSSTSRTC